MKLFLKGERCYTDKCAVERRHYAPGEHGKDRIKFSTYGMQLREKQKLRRIYGLLEHQFVKYFEKAEHQKGITANNLLILLERRLDSTIFKIGFVQSLKAARQLVKHRQILLNNKKVNIPSYEIKIGDVITLSPKTKTNKAVLESLEKMANRPVPKWIEFKKDIFEAKIINLPTKEDINVPVKEQYIVEFYSK